MNSENDIRSIVDYYLLHNMLLVLKDSHYIPETVLQRADVLNAECCGLNADEHCHIW